MRTRLGLKILGLSALVMGVMAIGTAGTAQAEPGACWGYINATSGKLECFSSTLEAKPLFELENKTGTLLIANVNFEVLCTGLEFDEGGLFAANGSILLGRLKFTGCIGLSRTPELKKLGACTPNDPISGPGTILTLKFTGLIKLHEGEPTVLLNPDPEAAGVLAHINMGEECSIGEEILVKGELVLWDCKGKASFEEHKLTHLIEEYPKLQLMTVGVNKATLDGSANVTLATPHNLLKWAGKAA